MSEYLLLTTVLRLGAQSVTLLMFVMFESKKTQILIAHQKQGIDRTQKSFLSRQKKFPSRQKKFPYGLEDFAPVFGKVTTPYVMFESKKLKFLLLIRRKI